MPSGTPTTRIREIVDPRDASLTRAYRLLVRWFSADERIDKAEWVGSLRERADGMLSDLAWHLVVAEDARGKVIGLVSGTYLGNVNVGVIGYLAIDQAARALGLGSRLRQRLRRAFERDAQRVRGEPLEAIIGEVSPSNPWLRTLRRVKGVIVLDVPYFQPQLRRGDPPSPFSLYYEPIARPRTRVPARALRQILYAIWRRVYRIARPLDQPAFRAMLRALEGRRLIGPAPARVSARPKRTQ